MKRKTAASVKAALSLCAIACICTVATVLFTPTPVGQKPSPVVHQPPAPIYNSGAAPPPNTPNASFIPIDINRKDENSGGGRSPSERSDGEALARVDSAGSITWLDESRLPRPPLPPRVASLLVVPVVSDGTPPPLPEQIMPMLRGAALLQERASHGHIKMTWEIGPTVSITTKNGGCGTITAQEIFDSLQRVVDQIELQGVVVGERIVVGAFGRLGCSFSGYAGSDIVRTKDGGAIMMQGYGLEGFYAATTLVHELGHVFGLWHPQRAQCENIRDLSSCTGPPVEYQDPLDLMGVGRAEHGYSAYSQTLLGIDNRMVAALGVDADYYLPANSPFLPAPTTLVIPSHGERALFLRGHGGPSQERLWGEPLEIFGLRGYNISAGVEVQRGPWGEAGAPRRAFTAVWDEKGYLRDFSDLTLTPGSIVRDYPGLELEVLSADSEGAMVRVRWLTLPPPKPTRVRAKALMRGARISWLATPPRDPRARITHYQVRAIPGGRSCRTVSESCVIRGLSLSKDYRFEVTSWNELGASAPVSSRPLRPHTKIDTRLTYKPNHGLAITVFSDAPGITRVRLTTPSGRIVCRHSIRFRRANLGRQVICPGIKKHSRKHLQLHAFMRGPGGGRYALKVKIPYTRQA